MTFFEGFTLEHGQVSAGTLRLRHAGSGPPLLLLHGNPQTHHRIFCPLMVLWGSNGKIGE